MSSASKIFDLRNYYFYSSGNTFTGSLGDFSYKIEPSGDTLKAVTWHGMLCSELAQIENEMEFPFTEEGFSDMVKWLEEIYSGEKNS